LNISKETISIWKETCRYEQRQMDRLWDPWTSWL
jgi:hypothetical protein